MLSLFHTHNSFFFVSAKKKIFQLPPLLINETSEILVSPSMTQIDPCDLVCRESGFLRPKNDCQIYYVCVNRGGGNFSKYKFKCPYKLYFDLISKSCIFEKYVDCNNGCQYKC